MHFERKTKMEGWRRRGGAVAIGLCAAAGVVFALAPAPATAQVVQLTRLVVTSSASAAAAPGGTPDAPIQTVDVYGPPTPAPIDAEAIASDGVVGASAFAQARGELGFGWFRGLATADAATDPGFFLAESLAAVVAGSDDWITIQPGNPALVGTIGTVTGAVLADGAIDASNAGAIAPGSPASASWSFQVLTAGELPIDQAFVQGSFLAGQGLTGDPPGSYLLDFDLVLGEPTRLSLIYELRAEARYRFSDPAGGAGRGESLFSSTFTWQGIREVRDAQNQPIAYTLTSLAGVDWTQPVPEPGPASASLAALAGLAALRGGGRPRRGGGA